MLNDRYPASMNASIPGLSIIQTDFYKFNPERKFDLVLCNQVMEHVSQPGKFAQKLLEIGNIVIASVPYMWPEESGFGHLQHKISIDKFLGWYVCNVCTSKMKLSCMGCNFNAISLFCMQV